MQDSDDEGFSGFSSSNDDDEETMMNVAATGSGNHSKASDLSSNAAKISIENLYWQGKAARDEGKAENACQCFQTIIQAPNSTVQWKAKALKRMIKTCIKCKYNLTSLTSRLEELWQFKDKLSPLYFEKSIGNLFNYCTGFSWWCPSSSKELSSSEGEGREKEEIDAFLGLIRQKVKEGGSTWEGLAMKLLGRLVHVMRERGDWKKVGELLVEAGLISRRSGDESRVLVEKTERESRKSAHNMDTGEGSVDVNAVDSHGNILDAVNFLSQRDVAFIQSALSPCSSPTQSSFACCFSFTPLSHANRNRPIPLELAIIELEMWHAFHRLDALALRYWAVAAQAESSVPHPLLMARLREIGAWLSLAQCAWNQALGDFFEAVRCYDAAGAAEKRIFMIKGLVLAHILAEIASLGESSSSNSSSSAAGPCDPFASPEIAAYREATGLVGIRKLYAAWQSQNFILFIKELQQQASIECILDGWIEALVAGALDRAIVRELQGLSPAYNDGDGMGIGQLALGVFGELPQSSAEGAKDLLHQRLAVVLRFESLKGRFWLKANGETVQKRSESMKAVSYTRFNAALEQLVNAVAAVSAKNKVFS